MVDVFIIKRRFESLTQPLSVILSNPPWQQHNTTVFLKALSE